MIGAIRAYQLCLSPWFGRDCRFLPTCSAYAIDAVERFGPVRGAWLAAKRIARCHPWGGSGYDPVPEAATPRGGHSARDGNSAQGGNSARRRFEEPDP